MSRAMLLLLAIPMVISFGYLLAHPNDAALLRPASPAAVLERNARDDPGRVADHVLIALDLCVPAIRATGGHDVETVRLAATALTVMFASDASSEARQQAMVDAVNAEIGNADFDPLHPRLVAVQQVMRDYLRDDGNMACVFERTAASLGA